MHFICKSWIQMFWQDVNVCSRCQLLFDISSNSTWTSQHERLRCYLLMQSLAIAEYIGVQTETFHLYRRCSKCFFYSTFNPCSYLYVLHTKQSFSFDFFSHYLHEVLRYIYSGSFSAYLLNPQVASLSNKTWSLCVIWTEIVLLLLSVILILLLVPSSNL